MIRFVVVLGLLASCTPRNIARTSCQSELLGVADPWSCTVSAESLEGISSVAFSTESRNKVAKAKIALAVAKGSLRVGYFDVEGEKHVTASPGSPIALEAQLPLHRDRRSFTLTFEPQGKVEGLSGAVSYSTP